MSTFPNTPGTALSEAHAAFPFSGTQTLRTTALPPASRRTDAEPAHHTEQSYEYEAFRSLVSAACYLSFNAQGDPEAMLEAIQILHGLAMDLREERNLNLSRPAASPTAEDHIWESARSRWERQRLVDSAIRFVKSPDAGRSQKSTRRSGWERLREAWRRTTRVQSL